MADYGEMGVMSKEARLAYARALLNLAEEMRTTPEKYAALGRTEKEIADNIFLLEWVAANYYKDPEELQKGT